MDPKRQSQRREGHAIGYPLRHHRRTDSTNARLKELAAAGAPHGTVVTADEQTAGRGRQGRAWVAPPGRALLYSLLLRQVRDHPLLPLATALAVCETAEDLAPAIACTVKWPNDIQVGERKLAGILIEARPQDDWAVVGVGLNLSIAPGEFPFELRETATSLFDPSEGERGESRRSLPAVAPAGLPPIPFTAAAILSRRLGNWLAAEGDEVLTAWTDRDALRGREIAWDDGSDGGGSGIARGVDGRGSLLVDTSGGAIALAAGEVHLL